MIEPVYRPPGVRFVPVADLSPAERAVAWRADDLRGDVRGLVAAVVETAEERAGGSVAGVRARGSRPAEVLATGDEGAGARP